MFITKNPILKEATRFIIVVYRSAFCHLMAVLTAFMVGVIIARTLGPGARGTISWLISITVFSSTIAQMGLGDVSRKIVSLERKENFNGLFFAVMLTTSIVSMALILPVVSFVIYDNENIKEKVLVIALVTAYTFFLSTQMSFKGMAAGIQSSKIINKSIISDKIFLMVAVAALAYLGKLNLMSAFSSYVASMLFCVAILFINLRKYLQKPIILGKAKLVLKLFYKLMLLSMLLRILILAVQTTINMTLFEYEGPKALGFYSNAKVFVDSILILGSMCEIFLIPKLLTIPHKRERTKFIFLVGVGILTTGGAAAWLVNYFAEEIMIGLYGINFFPSIFILKMLTPYIPLIIFVTLQAAYIYTHTDTWYLLISPGLSFISMLVVSSYLIPAYGVIGAICSNYAYASFAIFFNFFVIYLIRNKEPA